MSKLIQTLHAEKQKRLLQESEGEMVKTSISISKENMIFIDALAEYYGTTRTDIVSTEMGFAIDAACIATDRQDLLKILDIAAQKSSQWDVSYQILKDKPESLEGEE